jgi:hypothetical protein
METNKKLRLIIILQLIAIFLLVFGLIWETQRHGESTITTEQEGLGKTVAQLPDQVFAVENVESADISIVNARTYTQNYRSYLSTFLGPSLPGTTPRPTLYKWFHGPQADTLPTSVVSYYVQGEHLQDMLNQTVNGNKANVVLIYPAFRNVPPTGSASRPGYTFVLAGGWRNPTDTTQITLIKTRTVPRTPGGMAPTVVYDELGPCPKGCPGFE